MRQTLIQFISILKHHGVRVSPAETIDAMHAMSVLDFANKDLLRNGLSMTLAKTTAEKETFFECFDRFFKLELPDINLEKLPDHLQPDTDVADSLQNQLYDSTKPQGNESDILNELAHIPLIQQLMTNNRSELALTLTKAAIHVELSEIKMFTQKGLYTRKILDSIGEEHLRDAISLMEKSNDPNLDQAIKYRDLLRHEVKDFVEREYMLQAEARNRQISDDILSEARLGNIERYYFERAQKLIEKMAKKLANRYGRQIKRTRNGRLNVSKTLHDSVAYDGVPFKTHWKKIIKDKPKIFAVCDVSGSVAPYAKFLLIFLYALQDVLPKVRSFAFSSHLGEVSSLFDEHPIAKAIEIVNWKYGGATDYGGSFQDFKDLAMQEIDRRSTVLILGDARNNGGDPKIEILRALYERSKQVIWLNPEPLRAWGTGDSEMIRYQTACHIYKECGNLRKLERVIDTLVKSTR